MPESIVTDQESSTNFLEAAVELIRLLPPNKTEKYLDLLIGLRPDLVQELKDFIDLPSQVLVATSSVNREFLPFAGAIDDDGNLRCPFDDRFYSKEGTLIEQEVANERPDVTRTLENGLNEAVAAYASLYYGSDVITTAYCQEEHNSMNEGLSVAVLIKKIVESNEDSEASAVWDSLHIFEVEKGDQGDDYTYRQTSTVILSFENSVETLKNIKLSGSLIRQNESKASISGNVMNHIVHVGAMLEESEGRLRNDLQNIYFGRTHDFINELRQAVPDGYLRNQNDLRAEMMAKLANINK